LKRWSKWKKERIPLYQNYQTGKINEEEYLVGKEEIRDQLRMYDGDFSCLDKHTCTSLKSLINTFSIHLLICSG